MIESQNESSNTELASNAETYDVEESTRNNLKREEEQFTRLTARTLVFFKNYGGSCFVIWFFAAFLVIEASVDLSKKFPAPNQLKFTKFALAYGLITATISGANLALKSAGRLQRKHMLATSIFLLAWSIVGVGVITFKSPYTFPGNGYFATWITFFGSYSLAREELAKFEAFERMYQSIGDCLLPLTASSLMVVFSSFVLCVSTCDSLNIYAISSGAISIFICLLLAFPGRTADKNIKRIIASLLLSWWIVAVLVLTIASPFKQTGNGYFSVWASLLFSLLLVEYES